jgi:hypothetical protein
MTVLLLLATLPFIPFALISILSSLPIFLFGLPLLLINALFLFLRGLLRVFTNFVKLKQISTAPVFSNPPTRIQSPHASLSEIELNSRQAMFPSVN